jgi:D-glycero-D-manno-heptose 1,7-bisphosphate phosphatase
MDRDYNLYKAVFLDKDGTLIPDIPYNVNPDLISIQKETIRGLRLLRDAGYLLIVISNQPGIAKGYFTEYDLGEVESRIAALLDRHDLLIDAFYYCPHDPDGLISNYAITCDCRKPLPGLILRAARDFHIDPGQSWMIGDILNDVEAGNRAGCQTILINNGNETEWVINSVRKPAGIAANIYEAAHFILQYEHHEKDKTYLYSNH